MKLRSKIMVAGASALALARTPRLATRAVRISAVPLLLAGMLGGVAGAVPAVAARTGPRGRRHPSP